MSTGLVSRRSAAGSHVCRRESCQPSRLSTKCWTDSKWGARMVGTIAITFDLCAGGRCGLGCSPSRVAHVLRGLAPPEQRTTRHDPLLARGGLQAVIFQRPPQVWPTAPALRNRDRAVARRNPRDMTSERQRPIGSTGADDAADRVHASPFFDLGLDVRIVRALVEEGYAEPSPVQVEAIPPLLEGRDLLGCAQTGTGKTAAFLLPVLQRLTQAPRKDAIRALVLPHPGARRADRRARRGLRPRHRHLATSSSTEAWVSARRRRRSSGARTSSSRPRGGCSI
jgi:hypothetical protein